MSSTILVEDKESFQQEEKPGFILAVHRQAKGISQDYVANKLHLRVQLIEQLEADDYSHMPEAVFIRGYLRAYANLLELEVEPILHLFNQQYTPPKQPERMLWQSSRQTHHAEHLVRGVTVLFVVGALIAVAMWWHKNKDSQHLLSSHISQQQDNKSETEIRLTDLSKMRSLLSANSAYSTNGEN